LRQKVQTSASEEPYLIRKLSALETPLPLDCGRRLWSAPYPNTHDATIFFTFLGISK